MGRSHAYLRELRVYFERIPGAFFKSIESVVGAPNVAKNKLICENALV